MTLTRPPPGAPEGALSPAVEALPPALRARVLEGCVEWTVPAGRLVAAQGHPAEVCFGVATGMLRLHRAGAHGQPVVFDLMEPGRWVGCTHTLADAPLPFGVVTVGRCALLVLRRSTLLEILQARPADTAAWVAKTAAAEAGSLLAQLGVLATGSVEERVRWLLGLLADRFSRPVGDRRRILVRLTQSEMGDIVGASRQRVNQALGALQRQGRFGITEGWMEVAAHGP